MWLISWAFVSGVLWLGGQLMSDLPHLLWCVFGGGVTGSLRPLWHCGGTSTEGLQLGPHREELRKGRIPISRKGAPNIKSLGQLFNTTAMTISRAVKDIRPLLEAHGVHLPASTARFRTQEDIARFLDPDKAKIKPTC